MDLYVVLGLRHGATESEIKRAYRRLARRFHPDINPGDRLAEARFRQILDAYETLIDPDRRSRYDSGAGPEDPGDRRSSGFGRLHFR
jgi:curved DNA-binding protein CbpA